MDERGAPKRIRLGDAVSVGDGESRRQGGGSMAVPEDEADGIDQGPGVIQVMQGLVADSKPEVASSSEGREMSSLDTDLLVKVMSYLPQRDRGQLVLVNRHWKETVWDGSALWRKVEVVGMWDIWSKEGRRKGRHANMLRLLHAAEEVEFSTAFTHNPSYKAIGGVLGAGLRVLRLPHLSVNVAGLESIITKCTLLEALLLKGGALGDKSIRICHPKLRKLEIQVQKFDRRFKVDCPSLTHLSTTRDDEDDRLLGYMEAIEPPSLRCPSLTSLHLSSLHCASGVLESMAAQCPDIKVLHAYCTPLSPPSVTNLFKSLEVLTFKASVDTPKAALIQHPQREPEEEPSSPAACATLEVNPQYIQELGVSDCLGFVSGEITWPSLEMLTIYECGYNAGSHGIECLTDLTSICPRLKSAVLEISGQVEGRWEFSHETLEELELKSAPCVPKRIACPKLRKLIIRRSYGGRSELSLKVECPDLTELQICRYSDLSFLPPILLELTSLKRLQISRARIEGAVVLEHSHIQVLVIEKCELEKVRLVMQSLVQVSVLESRMLWLTVDSAGKMWLDYTPMYRVGESVHKSIGGAGVRTLDLW